MIAAVSDQRVAAVEPQVELELVVNRDAEVADQRNRWLDRALLDRVRVDRTESHSASLMEAQRIEVVVAGDQPQAPRAAVNRLVRDRGQEGRSDLMILVAIAPVRSTCSRTSCWRWSSGIDRSCWPRLAAVR